MGDIALVAKSLHQSIKHRRGLFQTKVERRAGVAESEAWYTGCDYMEGLLCAFTEARQRVRVCKCVNYALYLDERRRP
jgi:hypothetical protein